MKEIAISDLFSIIINCIFDREKIDIYALIISGAAFFCAYRKNRVENMINLSKEISEMKQQCLYACSDFNKTPNKTTTFILNECVTEYANAFENACYLYFNGNIRKKDFDELYTDELYNLFNNKGFGEYLVIQKEQKDAYKYVKKFLDQKRIKHMKRNVKGGQE